MPWDNTSVVEMTAFSRSASGQQVLNVMHYRQQSTDPLAYAEGDLFFMVNQFIILWTAQVIPMLSVETVLEKVRGRVFDSVIANPTPPPATMLNVFVQSEIPLVPPTPGTRPAPELVSFDALGVQKLSDRAGRNFRGSIRFGTLADTDVTGNTYGAPYQAIISVNAPNFLNGLLQVGLVPTPWQMAIFSRTLALAAPPPFTDLRALTAGVIGARVNNFVTSQVSRKQSLTQPT